MNFLLTIYIYIYIHTASKMFAATYHFIKKNNSK